MLCSWETYITAIFKDEEKAKKPAEVSGKLSLQTASCFPHSSFFKMGVKCSSETSGFL
jgi:hypothetical protein